MEDGAVFLISPLFQAQGLDAGEIIEVLITRSVPDPLHFVIYIVLHAEFTKQQAEKTGNGLWGLMDKLCFSF